MEFKPSIFIGSSKEGLAVSKRIATDLEDLAEVTLWPEAFDKGRSYFDNLTSKIAFYDYAILVATGDDVIVSRGKSLKGARDNVLFEFGLFAGGLGISKVFYVMENGLKIPTDLTGIALPVIAKPAAADFEGRIADCVAEIRKQIIGKEKVFTLGFLPSTALAYGYFTNFVERTTERLLEDKAKRKTFRMQSDKKFRIKSLKFTILIPNDLMDNMFNKVKNKRLKDGWQKMKVSPKYVRDYDFSIDISKAADGELHLVDIPFTLNALKMAIDLYSKKEHLGKDFREHMLEYREIRNFKRTLEYLIESSAFTKGVVGVEVVDI